MAVNIWKRIISSTGEEKSPFQRTSPESMLISIAISVCSALVGVRLCTILSTVGEKGVFPFAVNVFRWFKCFQFSGAYTVDTFEIIPVVH